MLARLVVFALLIPLFFTGCTPGPSPKPQEETAEKTRQTAASSDCAKNPVRHFDHEQQAIRLARQTDGVYDAVAVQIDDKMNVGLDVRNFHRLRLKQIRKETFHRIREAFPDVELHVTTDSKVYRELKTMGEKPWNNEKKAACKEKQRLDELEEMMKG